MSDDELMDLIILEELEKDNETKPSEPRRGGGCLMSLVVMTVIPVVAVFVLMTLVVV